MPTDLSDFREVWLVDFEFSAPPGKRPDPVCLVAREYWSGRTLRLWQDELRARSEPPYPTDSGTLFVAYYYPGKEDPPVGRTILSDRPGESDRIVRPTFLPG